MTSDVVLSELEAHLGVEFDNKGLLKRAFIHSSFKNENPTMNLYDNQTLEFLGDAVLGLVISEHIENVYDSKMYFIPEILGPTKDEGKYSKFRDKFIGGLLSEIADDLGLDEYLLKGQGESKNDDGNIKRLEDLMEALIGAIFKDQGYNPTKKFVLKYFKPHIEKAFVEMYENELQAIDVKLENNSNDYFLLTYKGKILHELNKHEEALQVLDEALMIEPNYQEALSFKVYCLYELQKYELGLEVANRLIDLYPEYDFIWADRGDLLLGLGRIDEALESFKRALELEPFDPDTLYEVAKIYAVKKNKAEVLYQLETAIDMDNLINEAVESGTFKEDAKTDKEFSWLLNDKEFLEIIDGK